MDAAGMPADGLPAEDLQPQEPSPTTHVLGKDSSAPKKTNIRKRTKTGCLTCRKRRIKCDEGKPTCNNCIKSKRQCEGYNTRVVFKEPLGTFQGGPFGPITYHPDPNDALLSAQLSSAQSKASSSQGPLPIIAPKPPSFDFGNISGYPYVPVYSGVARANSLTALGLSMNYPHYVMSQVSPNYALYPEEALGIANSPVQLSQQELLDFNLQSQSPDPPLQESLKSPMGRRHTAFARIERPTIPPAVPSASTITVQPPVKLESLKEEELWLQDEDTYMLPSDDENDQDRTVPGVDANQLGALVARRLHGHIDYFGTKMRSFHTLTEKNILTHYTPSSTDSPLNDPKTAAVFWYFVNVTAPALSMYERNPLDTTRIFSGEPVPKSQQHIWTYVFPVKSFHHPALLQAILALGSQQMAKLSGETQQASLKHYHLSIVRSSKNYQSPTRRAHPATLAATLLLGFYEVWNSDHEKWCGHMYGARVIIGETPLREMTWNVIAIQRRRRQQLEEMRAQSPCGTYLPPVNSFNNDLLPEVDLDIVARLHGKPVRLEGDLELSAWQASPRRCTEQDIENYEHVSDLYWWFCKMDVYQSFLGGSRLFMEYDLWTQCAPRSPIGRLNCVYGTFDHLLLLLGRVASFAANDLPRKHKAMDRESLANPTAPAGTSPPMFAGMFPGRGHMKVPRGFSPPRDVPPAGNAAEDIDLETSTHAALEEWERIRESFDVFKSFLGSDFQPLSPELQPSSNSPFGLALTYRTYSIAGIWMNYYMGLIILQRAHPSMPPFAMKAAHKCVRQTEWLANEIGRIVAGIHEDCNRVTVVSTLVGAAFIESCFPLFVAGVQLHDTAQRHWTIRRLHDITRLTGWQTGDQIANGCEGAWRKAYAMGVGPPYEPEPDYEATVHVPHVFSVRRIDERIQEINEGDVMRLGKKERAHLAFGLIGVEDDMERLALMD